MRTFLSSLVLAATAAAAPPSAREILDAAKAASGGEAWAAIRSSHATAQISEGGMKGSAESWDDVLTGRYVDQFELGPGSGAEGFDGKIVWQQDSSKRSREEGAAEAKEAAVDEAYRRSLAYWFPERWPADLQSSGSKKEAGVTYDVVRITPKGGRPFDVWVNASTHLFDRMVEKAAMETRTTFLSDYRPVEHVKIAFAQRTTNGEVKYDQRTALTRVELNTAIDDGRFQMPAPPPPDYAFASGKTSTTLPFELLNNHIYVDVKLNGAGPFRLLCDTGGANIITPTLAKKLGLKAEGALQGRGVGDKSEDVGLVKMNTLQLGDVTLSNQVFATFAMEPFSKVEGFEQSGLVGYEIFSRFVVTVDYQNRKLTLTAPSAFSYQGKGTVVPFKFKDQIPQVEGEIDGIHGTFDIDTGSRASLDLLTPFVEKNGLASKYSTQIEGVTGWGVGGPARAKVARATLLKLGAVEIKAPVAELSTQKKGAFSDAYVAGNVGAGVLKRFTVIFDYGNKNIIFEPNASYGTPDVFDRSGAWLNTDGKIFEVADVFAHGPAAKAGLKVGDQVIAVDGKPAATVSLMALRQRFRTEAPGTRILLTVKSGSKTREVSLELADLV